MKKSIREMALFMKGILPADIPETYKLKSIFKDVTDEESIRKGILAYRDFLYSFCDYLITNGNLYEKPPSKSKKDDDHHVLLRTAYPFLYNVQNVLLNIGYMGKLDDNVVTLIPGDLQLAVKLSKPKLIECLRLLSHCGIHFNGIDLDAKKPDISKVESLEISYPNSPEMMAGLKIMAIADKDLPYITSNRDIFLRCDYRVPKDEDTEITLVLKDYVNSLPGELQDFVLNLHQRYLDAGLTCKKHISILNVRFIYFYKSKELWTFSASVNTGYRLLIKAVNTHKYSDVIEKFPMTLQEKIAKGYGCEKKLYGERCQKGCHGFTFPIDNSILAINENIETWIDNELLCLMKRGK